MSLFPDNPVFNTASMLRRDKWLVRLRWFAIAGVFSGVGVLTLVDLVPQQQIWNIFIVGSILLGFNLVYMVYTSKRQQYSMLSLVTLLNVQMIVDLILLTFLIYFTGSEESPLVFFYVFHIILASIIFPGGFSYVYSFLVIILYSGLIILGTTGVIEHTCFLHEIHEVANFSVILPIWFIVVVTVFASAYLAQNVTSRHRRVHHSLQIANQKLKEVNESKTTFFRFASHEMKAPISTIQSTLMVVEDILGEAADERVKDMLSRAINRTGEVIQMLKDLADLTYGNFQEQQTFDVVDLKVILSELVMNNRPNAQRKHIDFDLQSPKRDCPYWGDALALRKIFLNLINNALRYTLEGGRVDVRLEAHDEYYQIQVQDTGVGIPESEQVNIFKEFYRTPSARQQVQEGTGLGLAIVLRMVELHDGSITVSSKEGAGSTFTVTLPLEEHL